MKDTTTRLRKSGSHETLPNSSQYEPQASLPGGLKVPEDTPTASQNNLADRDRSREHAKQIAQRVVSASVAGPFQTTTPLPTQPASNGYGFDATLNNDKPSGSARKRPHSTTQSTPLGQSEEPTQFRKSTLDEHGVGQETEHAQKRMRSNGWPLQHTTLPNSTKSSPTPRSKHSKVSLTAVPISSMISARSSKFLEGSMNDRVSSQPPSAFMTEGEEVLNRFLAEHKVDHFFRPTEEVNRMQLGGLTHHPNQSIPQTTANDGKPRQSGIFRFGRSIASAFNPMNIWNDVCTKWKEAAKEFDPVVIRDREYKAKAEEIYAKMKEDGSLYTHGAPYRDEDGKVIAVSYYPSQIPNQRASVEANVERYRNVLRDSGIDVDTYRSSAEGRRESEVSTEGRKLEPPAAPGSTECSKSPTLGSTSAQKSLLKFKKPSMPSLKKIRSEVQPSSSKRRVDGDNPSSYIDNNTPTPAPAKNHIIRKEPSRKDLQMQQKLTKRVSDLESKLEAARRDLNQALGDVPPMQEAVMQPIGRKAFVPGALPSLPSEGVLAAHGGIGVTEGEEDTVECRKAKENNFNPKVEAPRPSKSGDQVTPHEESSQRKETIQSTALDKGKKKSSATKGGKKRRTSGGADNEKSTYKPDVEGDEDVECEAPKDKTPPKRKPGRPKRSLELGESVTAAVTDTAPVSKRKKTGDEGKGSVRATTLEPIGPRISDFVIEKTTEYRSFTHLNQPGAAVLGRSRSVTPGRGGRGHRRSTSPPPSLSYSRPVTRQSSASEDPISIMPGQDEVPPVPKLPKGLARIVRLASAELDPVVHRVQVNVDPEKQPLRGEKDDFEWPEDVF
ncbi:MAG: hypothetical protein M1812_005252 [Candelaria pacifica]|nr:MAG: hypothetical protein M1812_005252 [Candelaria pacifica]